jgi:hypothetical protein
MFEHGILADDTFIWNKDMTYWQMAKDVDLFPASLFKRTTGDPLSPNLASEWSEQKKATYPNGRPLVRTLARFLDLSICSLFLITIVSIFMPRFIVALPGVTIFILSLILWIIIEPIILSIFGTTIGKAFLNAKLRTVDGERIDFITAFQRSIFVNAAGMGFGLPIINLICFYFSFFDLKKNGKSTWDQQIGTVVLYGKVSSARLIIASLFPIGFLIAGLAIN